MKRMNVILPIQALLVCATFVFSATDVTGQPALSDLDLREGLLYVKDSDSLYTGPVTDGGGQGDGHVREGVRSGQWRYRYEDGSPAMSMEYVDGVMRTRTLWSELGYLSGVYSFDEAGKLSGPAMRWDGNGILRETRNWENGLEHGESRLYDHEGNLLRSTHYVNGERDGSEIWWFPDGSPQWKTEYAGGQRTGSWEQYHPSGRLLMESTWKEGQLMARTDHRR